MSKYLGFFFFFWTTVSGSVGIGTCISYFPLTMMAKASVKWLLLNLTSVACSCFLLISCLFEQLNLNFIKVFIGQCVKSNLYSIHQHWMPNIFLLVCGSVVSLYHYKMITYEKPLKIWCQGMEQKSNKAMRRNEQCKWIPFDFLFTTEHKTWSPLKDLWGFLP